MDKSSIVTGWKNENWALLMGFVKSNPFPVFSVSNRTLQSFPGVKSRIYCVDQNPIPYSASLIPVPQSQSTQSPTLWKRIDSVTKQLIWKKELNQFNQFCGNKESIKINQLSRVDWYTSLPRNRDFCSFFSEHILMFLVFTEFSK